MRYTVVWHKQAQDDLTDMWLRAIERSAITRAADDIDRILRENPTTKGNVAGETRLLFVGPLAVSFIVNDDDRTARVVHIWRDSTAN